MNDIPYLITVERTIRMKMEKDVLTSGSENFSPNCESVWKREVPVEIEEDGTTPGNLEYFN